MVNSNTIIRDVVFFIKNFLSSNLTDPETSRRPANQQFIMTSYPSRPVTLPVVTIKDINSTSQNLGFQSEATWHEISIEVRVWGKTTKERDSLADLIYQLLKDNQIGASGTSQANDLHDFKLISSTNIDSEEPTVKSKVMTFSYKTVAT